MCIVVNKYKEDFDVYIGRGSKWGNPYPLKDTKDDGERRKVIKKYRKHLQRMILSGKVTLDDLRGLHGKRLGCFCKPKPCHGDIIVSAVEWAMTYPDKKDEKGVDNSQ